MTPGGFSHSETHGSKPANGSPWISLCGCVLHRLSVPKHPPSTLCSLTALVPSEKAGRGSNVKRIHSASLPGPGGPGLSSRLASIRFSKNPGFPARPTYCGPCGRIWFEELVAGRANADYTRPGGLGSGNPQKGGDPAAGSPTATLLRLSPSYRSYLRHLPPLRVGSATSGTPGFRGLTGGVYKAQEHIHRGVADPRLLAIPTSCRRISACNPN